MADFTTRLGLRKPGGGSSGLITPDEAVDIDVINDNMDRIDGAIGAGVVTSGTRPTGPYNGQIIYETDTRNLRIFIAATGLWALVNVHVGAAEPANKQQGDLWRDTSA